MRENSPLESECGSRALKIPWDIRKSNYYHDFRNIVDPDKDLVHINQPEQKHQLPFVFFCYITYCNVTSFPCKTSTTCTRIWSMSISTSTSIHTRRRRAFVVVIFAQIASESYKTFYSIRLIWYVNGSLARFTKAFETIAPIDTNPVFTRGWLTPV